MKKITIIGGGASGTLLAVNLMKESAIPLEINFIEKKTRLGRGVAYSTVTDFHLLNVPAAKMGAFPDDIEHFHRWLAKNNYNFAASAFVPRKIYGEYLQDVFWETFKEKNLGIVLNMFDDEAVDLAENESGTEVFLSSGRSLISDKTILAFGNFLPPHPRSENREFITAEKYFQNPWNPVSFEKLNATDDVFIIGTGLTGIDVILSLYNKGHQGKIYGFSTRGLLPAVHELGHTYPSFADELKSQTRITDLLKIVRRHIKKAEAEGSNWRGVIDALRPQTQETWQNLPLEEKRYFMQHLSRYWNVARHRMPPECAKILADLQAKNQLQILSGRLKNIEAAGEKFDIVYSDEGIEKHLAADAIFNCIGSESNFEKIDSPLVKNLTAKNLIKPDSLRMGIDATPDGKVINGRGNASEKLLTLGTALKGILWETTAMPEIRGQAKNLALRLLTEV